MSPRNFDKLPNFVLPVVLVEQHADGWAFRRFCGTAFLLATRSEFVLTAGHVAHKLPAAGTEVPAVRPSSTEPTPVELVPTSSTPRVTSDDALLPISPVCNARASTS